MAFQEHPAKNWSIYYLRHGKC